MLQWMRMVTVFCVLGLVVQSAAEEPKGHRRIELEDGDTLVFCGDSIAKATIIGLHLEEACREQLAIQASGMSWSWPEGEEQARKFRGIGQPRGVEQFFEYLCRKLASVEALGDPSFPGKPIAIKAEP